MATPEALTKYYDCLKDSFNKIQLKDNKTALVNAALRPKIREEFAKSKQLLISYLNYLRVFTLIYSDKFSNICISVICPLFRDHRFTRALDGGSSVSSSSDGNQDQDTTQLVHETLCAILKSKPELTDELIHSLIRLFPDASHDDEKIFSSYLSNTLQVCTYVRGEPLTNLVARILDRVNPPIHHQSIDRQKHEGIRKIVEDSYDLIYQLIDDVQDKQSENFSASLLAAFTREFLTSDNDDNTNQLLLYICSKNGKIADLFINLLWATFTDVEKSHGEREASILYACSFMSRANYIGLEQVMNHIETAIAWYNDLMNHGSASGSPHQDNEAPSQGTALVYPLIESILYLITQRYREMYEEPTIIRLKNLDLDTILSGNMKPLEACNPNTVSRFREVATLYGISCVNINFEPKSKRQKVANNSPTRVQGWKIPFNENCDNLPSKLSGLYRNYFNHRNFTIYRE